MVGSVLLRSCRILVSISTDILFTNNQYRPFSPYLTSKIYRINENSAVILVSCDGNLKAGLSSRCTPNDSKFSRRRRYSLGPIT
jgi:hypothetical protein